MGGGRGVRSFCCISVPPLSEWINNNEHRMDLVLERRKRKISLSLISSLRETRRLWLFWWSRNDKRWGSRYLTNKWIVGQHKSNYEKPSESSVDFISCYNSHTIFMKVPVRVLSQLKRISLIRIESTDNLLNVLVVQMHCESHVSSFWTDLHKWAGSEFGLEWPVATEIISDRVIALPNEW